MAEALNYDELQAQQHYFDLGEDDDTVKNEEYWQEFQVNGLELSNPESDGEFFTANNLLEASSPPEPFNRRSIRRSMSLSDLQPLTLYNHEENQKADDDGSLMVQSKSRVEGFYDKRRGVSKETINRLAQPKKYPSNDLLSNNKYVSVAEQMYKFQQTTPERFRFRPSPLKGNKPKIFVKSRSQTGSSNNFNKRELESKPEVTQRLANAANLFKASALPVVDKKALNAPKTAGLLKCKETVASQELNKKTYQASKPSSKFTVPKPFTFEQRDKKFLRKKEEFLKKVLEEERKAREFHARPVPRHILYPRDIARNNNHQRNPLPAFPLTVENFSQFTSRPIRTSTPLSAEENRNPTAPVQTEGEL